MPNLSLFDFEQFPKAELHRHVDGSVPVSTIIRLAAKNGLKSFHLRTGQDVSLSDDSLLSSFYQIHTTNSTQDMLSRFDLVLEVMQTPEDIEEVFYDCMVDVAQKNIFYVEWTFAPAYHTRQGMKYEEIIESALRGINRGKRDANTIGKLICAINREACDKEKEEDKNDPDGMRLVRAATRFMNRGVVALGLVCDEAAYPPNMYDKAFQAAENAGLDRIPHAGEMGERRQENIRYAVNTTKAKRVGHGIPVGSDDKMIDLLRRNNVGLELNPWSNVLLGFIENVEQLNADKLLQSGIRVSINSDDPILLQKELADNFNLLFEAHAFGEQELVRFTKNAIDSSCMSNRERNNRMDLFSQKSTTDFSKL